MLDAEPYTYSTLASPLTQIHHNFIAKPKKAIAVSFSDVIDKLAPPSNTEQRLILPPLTHSFLPATMTNSMVSLGKIDEERTSSPLSIVEYDDNNSVSSDGLAGLLLDCEEDLGKQQQEDSNRSYSNRSRSKYMTLPTLEEVEEDPLSPPGSPVPEIVMPTSAADPPLIKSIQQQPVRVDDDDDDGGLDHTEIKLLNNKASKYALRGDEQAAIKTYKKALRLTRVEVARINRAMLDSKHKEKYAKTTLHIILHDEWTEVALIIADIRTMMAILYERVGDYERAIMCCKEARDVYERQSQFDGKNNKNATSSATEMMGQMVHMTNKMEDAKDTYQVRKQLHEDSVETHRQICVTPDMAIRDLLYEALFDKLSAALGLELESLGRNHPQVSDTMAFLSKLYQERCETEKALHSMSQAVGIAEVSLGILHPRTGEKYRDFARMFEEANRNDTDLFNAILYYEKSISTFKEAEGDHSLLVGATLNDVAVIHIRCKQYDVAVEKLSDALAVYESCVDNGKDTFTDTVQVWRNLAECYVLRKEWSSASTAFKSALNVQRDARKLYDTTGSTGNSDDKDVMPSLVSDESIADTLKRLGKSYAAQEDYENAFGTLLEALTLFQTVYEKVKTPEKQDQVANIIYCIAEVKESHKKYGEAFKLYEESLQLRTSSDKERPKEKRSNYVHCAMCLSGIGSCRMARKEYSHAFKAYNKALECTRREKLPEFHPIVQMLWDKSRVAARKMGRKSSILEKNVARSKSSGDSTTDSPEKPPKTVTTYGEQRSTGQAASWSYTASRLQRKALIQKSKQDIDGAIESTKIVLELQQAALAKKQESRRSYTKEQRHVADTFVSLAQLVLIKDATREAEAYFKEADELYRASGMEKEDDCLQEISRELDRLRWQQKQKIAHHKK